MHSDIAARLIGKHKNFVLTGEAGSGKTEVAINLALLMAAEGSGFEDVRTYYDHLMEHLRWRNLGHVLAGGNMDAGDIDGKPELQAAYELGRSIT